MGKDKDTYNSIPVHYCNNCLSLKIRILGQTDNEYCDECGSTDITISDIHTWESLYYKKYGCTYLNTEKNGRKKQTYL